MSFRFCSLFHGFVPTNPWDWRWSNPGIILYLSQITKALFALFSLHTVDGKSPATPHGMYKNPVNSGKKYQPQLLPSTVSLPHSFCRKLPHRLSAEDRTLAGSKSPSHNKHPRIRCTRFHDVYIHKYRMRYVNTIYDCSLFINASWRLWEFVGSFQMDHVVCITQLTYNARDAVVETQYTIPPSFLRV